MIAPHSKGRKRALSDVMPAMISHAGVWEGTYIHLDAEGELLDTHKSTVSCEFPTTGPFDYIQNNLFRWSDGREYRAELPGTLKEDGKLWWDTETFHGCAWETDFGLIMLNLNRKDNPGANFIEIIAMGDTNEFRSRTWHWFKQGKLYKRTLCEERRTST